MLGLLPRTLQRWWTPDPAGRSRVQYNPGVECLVQSENVFLSARACPLMRAIARYMILAGTAQSTPGAATAYIRNTFTDTTNTSPIPRTTTTVRWCTRIAHRPTNASVPGLPPPVHTMLPAARTCARPQQRLFPPRACSCAAAQLRVLSPPSPWRPCPRPQARRPQLRAPHPCPRAAACQSQCGHGARRQRRAARQRCRCQHGVQPRHVCCCMHVRQRSAATRGHTRQARVTTVSPVMLSVVDPVAETLSELLESDSEGRRGGERHGDPAGVPGKNGRAEEDARGVPETDATREAAAKPIGPEAKTGEANADATRKGCVEPTEANRRPRRSARSGEDQRPAEVGQGSGDGDAGGDGVPRSSTGSAE
jgi:hypothetical protein